MANPFSDPEMQEIFEGFLVETNELLENISQDLMTIENEPDNMDLLNQIFRSFHTIKGTSSFMGFSEISTITHEAEDLLNKLRRSELVISIEITDVLLEVHDWIERLIERIISDNKAPFDYSETISKIIRIRDGKDVEVKSPTVSAAPITEKSTNSSKISTSALDAVLSNKEIIQGHGDFSDDELAMLQAAFAEVNLGFASENNKQNQSTTNSETTNVVEKTKVVESEIPKNEHLGTPVLEHKEENKNLAANVPKAQQETIRIDVSRLEILMDLSGELVLGRNRLAQITEQLSHEIENKEKVRDLVETTAQVDFVTSEIQSAVMRMRMVQIGKLYQKAPRIVRDLAKEFGKHINLVVKGEETEIDRGIIEELNDPLVHMIRNSCDHGIESQEIRKANGKNPSGTITLDAEQEGNHIVLRISDDGAGMDPEKLKNKALEKGVITAEQAAQMTQREAFQLIFMPGFSTAVKVSSVSGRGVGMDVVRTNIQKLKGLIEIESELGKGSTFVIKLPLTLAIIQGLLVKVQNETYAIPLTSVDEVVSIDDVQVQTVNQQEVIRIRQEVYPLMRLDQAVKLKNTIPDLKNRYAVVVGIGMQRVGMVVDELLGQQEIVIKSLGEYLGNIHGIAGSTILGDGRVIMIVDVAEMINFNYVTQNA